MVTPLYSNRERERERATHIQREREREVADIISYITAVPNSESFCICRQNQILAALECNRANWNAIIVVLLEEWTRATEIIEQYLQPETERAKSNFCIV